MTTPSETAALPLTIAEPDNVLDPDRERLAKLRRLRSKRAASIMAEQDAEAETVRLERAIAELGPDPWGNDEKTEVPPSLRRWRALVGLARDERGEITATVCAWFPRLAITMDVIGMAKDENGGMDPRSFESIDYAYDPENLSSTELAYHAIPQEVYEQVSPGVPFRCHVDLNIGAEEWHQLTWPTDPERWDLS